MNVDEISICARASELIYGTPTDTDCQLSCETALKEIGFADFAWIKKETSFKDICAFVATSDKYHLLTFRGTDIPQDWMTDLACTPVRFDWVFTSAPAIGEIHAGFGHCLSDGVAEIITALAVRDFSKPLLVTGHSLGGALAAHIFQLLARPCRQFQPFIHSVNRESDYMIFAIRTVGCFQED